MAEVATVEALPLEMEPEVPPQTIAVQEAGLAAMFERFATDPRVDVEKLERLIGMQERIAERNAKAAFNAAFAKMQPRIPVITERGHIEVKGTVRSTYAPLEDIHDVIKPILAEFGFAIRHRTEWPDTGKIRIVGILSHEEGHAEESTFESGLDKSDFRTDIQSQGSTISYGRRYTTQDLLNIATRRQDNDGRTAGRPHPPKGYETLLPKLEEAAMQGSKELDALWDRSDPALKTFIINNDKDKWSAVKKAAGMADQARRAAK